LGPEKFGFWSLLTTIATTAVLMDLGLGSAVTRFVAGSADESKAEERRGAFTTGAALAAGLALLALPAGWRGRGARPWVAPARPAARVRAGGRGLARGGARRDHHDGARRGAGNAGTRARRGAHRRPPAGPREPHRDRGDGGAGGREPGAARPRRRARRARVGA